jgi:hypothetical protein
MSFEEPGNRIEEIQYFLITQAGDDPGHQGIVGKFLKVDYQRFFVRFSVQPETDQTLILIDEMMGVFFFFHKGPSFK